MTIQKVGVVGCGLMGSGIAQTCAQSGYETVVREINQELLDKGLKTYLCRLGYDGRTKGKLAGDRWTRIILDYVVL